MDRSIQPTPVAPEVEHADRAGPDNRVPVWVVAPRFAVDLDTDHVLAPDSGQVGDVELKWSHVVIDRAGGLPVDIDLPNSGHSAQVEPDSLAGPVRGNVTVRRYHALPW